jgi:undecaprenyl diphosphate synthase
MTPKHIGIILDGNGRWAKSRGMERKDGYAAGLSALLRIIAFCLNKGIEHLSVFAFSTENRARPLDEKRAIFSAVANFLQNPPKDCAIDFLGNAKELDGELSALIAKTNASKPKSAGLNLHIALNYGGRADIVQAVNKILQQNPSGAIDEETFSKYLSTANLPPLELVIRTGGQKRLSNFMLYEAAYSELIFLDTLFPDMTEQTMQAALDEYGARTRTFGA